MTYTSDHNAQDKVLSFAFRDTDTEAHLTRRNRRDFRRTRRWASCGF